MAGIVSDIIVSKLSYFCECDLHVEIQSILSKPNPPSDCADCSVFRGVRFSQCRVFSAMCLSIHAYIFTFTHKCTSNKALLTFTPQIVKNGPVPIKSS